MTPNEEKDYLIDLLFESALWRVDPDDPRCAIELEIRDRIQRLTSAEEDTDAKPEYQVESEVLRPEEYKAVEAARLNEHLERQKEKKRKQAVEAKSRWKERNVRVRINGETVWKPLAQCHREKLFPDNPKSTKFKWVWDEPQDKVVNKLSDELWEAHENGNDL